MNFHGDIAGVLLAAGYSSRMGAFKPLLPLGNEPVVTHCIKSMQNVPLHSIIVVVGYQSDQIIPLLKEEHVDWVFNPEYPTGMFSSIKAGIRKIPDSASGCFLSLVDSPLVPSFVYQEMINVHKEHPTSLIVPCYRGKKGHPLLIPSTLFPELLAYSGEKGLKFITDLHDEEMIRLEVSSEAVVMDMDTWQEYEEVLLYHQAHYVSEIQTPVKQSTESNRTLYLIRHGETKQQADKVFIGQWDVPLNDLGRTQAKEVAQQLLHDLKDTRTIYCSDLLRATETANLIAETMEQNYPVNVVSFSAFRELSLGEWDGQLIEDIKIRYPEEYQKRGENLLAYKIGNNSENFYDLRYRVLKKLTKLIEETTGDLVLVTHSGVIRVILSELMHLDLKDVVKTSIPKGSVLKIPISHRQQFCEP